MLIEDGGMEKDIKAVLTSMPPSVFMDRIVLLMKF
jgi:hypothetical protein